jgi:DGQHR domain-containing protein
LIYWLEQTMPRRSYQEIADDFERDIRSLLKRSGFDDVNGGPRFRLGDRQVDACGGSEETLLMIECKTSQRVAPRLADEIGSFRNKAQSLSRAAGQHSVYGRYRQHIFILATDFDVHSKDRKVAGRKVKVWDRAFTSHYEALASRIGRFAKFSILAELGIQPKHRVEACLPCIKHSMRKVNLFLFMADPHMILPWTYVARREVGREHYYQRFIETGKLNQIARYIQDQHMYFANAVVLALNEKPRFRLGRGLGRRFPEWAQGKVQFGFLHLPASYRSCLIIDGQHRLYGAAKAQTCPMMPMVALDGTSIEHQAQLFLDINSNQKQVPSDLVWDLEGEMNPSSKEGVISRVAKVLNQRGVLKGRVYIPEQGRKRRCQLKLSGICTAIANQRLTDHVLKNRIENPFYRSDPEALVRCLAKSLNAALAVVDRTFEKKHKEGFWDENSGMAVFMGLVGRIAAHCGRRPSDGEYRNYFKALRAHIRGYRTEEQLVALRQRCNSEAGREGVISEFLRAISRILDDETLSKGLPEDKLERRIKCVERGLADLVAEVLSAEDGDWFKHHVPEDIRNRASKLMQKENADGDHPQDYVTFGDCFTIIRQSGNWEKMKPRLTVRGSFNNQNQLEAACQCINDLRGVTAHGRGQLNDHDEALLHGYLGKFETILKI